MKRFPTHNSTVTSLPGGSLDIVSSSWRRKRSHFFFPGVLVVWEESCWRGWQGESWCEGENYDVISLTCTSSGYGHLFPTVETNG